MRDPIRHLQGITATVQESRRLRTLVLMSGARHAAPVLFLHGNLSSSTFWEETMLALADEFTCAAPDLRGYGLSDPDTRIDATGGFTDWTDDALALAETLGWERFHVVGHSLGGCVVWALLARAPERLLSATLVAPGPPCGLGGARDVRGEANHDDGAGSGGGLVHPLLAARIAAGRYDGNHDGNDDPFSPRAVMNRLYWKPPFRPEREDALLTALLQVSLGDDRFPGDTRDSPHWPGFAPGKYGPINALSPHYNQWVLPELLNTNPKPPVLWVYGTDDLIIRNDSPSDIGMQGKLGLRPDWPGEEIFPPQPIRAQVEHALTQYEQAGGGVTRLILPDVGHTPYLERPAEFRRALLAHLNLV